MTKTRQEDSFHFVESFCVVLVFFLRPPKTKRETRIRHTHTREEKKPTKMFMDCFDLAVVAQRIRFTPGISISFFVVSWSVFNHQKKRCKRIVRGCWTVFVFVCASIRCWGNISFSLNTRYLNKQNTIIIGVYRGKKWKIVIIFCE